MGSQDGNVVSFQGKVRGRLYCRVSTVPWMVVTSE